MYHRPIPTVRSPSSLAPSPVPSQTPSPCLSPLLPPSSFTYPDKSLHALPTPEPPPQPALCGIPLKYLSLITLAVQNAALAIVMHYSRISTPPERSYSPASAVLLNEILKGSISFIMALYNTFSSSDFPRYAPLTHPHHTRSPLKKLLSSLSFVCGDIFSPDCWKLSIPAILYVVQNSLQFVAISNLPVATFQVTYQMKILTTAAFSVALLRKKLSTTKWLSLFFLAFGVGIVQIQSATSNAKSAPMKEAPVGSAHDFNVHVMNPLKGFGAVTAACFTSGLAGVYFEMVLKNSKADLWVRNVQLSLFSLIPALLPILYAPPPPNSAGFVMDLFRNFGTWAWATVSIQVFGGLVTAVVIKYSDNIMKGFATSLSIVLSFLASVVLFDFRISWSFVIGATTVLTATWMYNQPPGKEPISIVLTGSSVSGNGTPLTSISTGGFDIPNKTSLNQSDMPILGHLDTSSFGNKRKKTSKISPFSSPRIIASALGMGGGEDGKDRLSPREMLDTVRYNHAPYGSPWPSRPPSRDPTPGLEQLEQSEAGLSPVAGRRPDETL
ncbi:UDP-galactose transporter [Leucoagaricus sp. SymC.cos]|nr:UDP-galactose transporter [Leucoagaricus sp. SymC.cos]